MMWRYHRLLVTFLFVFNSLWWAHIILHTHHKTENKQIIKLTKEKAETIDKWLTLTHHTFGNQQTETFMKSTNITGYVDSSGWSEQNNKSEGYWYNRNKNLIVHKP